MIKPKTFKISQDLIHFLSGVLYARGDNYLLSKLDQDIKKLNKLGPIDLLKKKQKQENRNGK